MVWRDRSHGASHLLLRHEHTDLAMFGKPPVHCPSTRDCYGKTFDFCKLSDVCGCGQGCVKVGQAMPGIRAWRAPALHSAPGSRRRRRSPGAKRVLLPHCSQVHGRFILRALSIPLIAAGLATASLPVPAFSRTIVTSVSPGARAPASRECSYTNTSGPAASHAGIRAWRRSCSSILSRGSVVVFVHLAAILLDRQFRSSRGRRRKWNRDTEVKSAR
jgi:hypothetical protein